MTIAEAAGTTHKHLQPAEQIVAEDEASIAEFLTHTSLPTLVMSLIHLTGDSAILERDLDSLTERDKDAIRQRAVQALIAYRDNGGKLPPPPDEKTIHKMMGFLVKQEVPQEYVPMFLEEISLSGKDTRQLNWDRDIPLESRRRFHTLVIGAGMSGLLAAKRLEEADLQYTVIEKNRTVGGTWLENTYPGCRVDVANHFYSYSFEPNHDWKEFFSQQQELLEYFERCADKFKVRSNIRFDTEVVAARYDKESKLWNVRVRHKDGAEEMLAANAVISAVGQLNRPKIPDIDGLGTFRGQAFHSSQWQHQHDLRGKRVAVIGTGASAFQLSPEIAKQVDQLFIFQRSAPWMTPNPAYHKEVSDGKKWALKHIPFYARWYRFLLFWPGSDGLLPSLKVDPDWPHQDRSVNALNEAARIYFTDYFTEQVGEDQELLEKVIPTYPPFCKRMLQDNGTWLSTLKRKNVELVVDPIQTITATGITSENGDQYDVDIIIFATGFHANRYLWPMEIVGLQSTPLNEIWGDEPAAYLGITVPTFPNLFCIYGPGTNLAHAGSIIFHSECQVRYIMGCIKALVENEYSAMDCKPAVHDAYNKRLQDTLSGMVWSHPGANSWYKNSKGRVTVTSPWRLVDYWNWTRQPNLEEFDFS